MIRGHLSLHRISTTLTEHYEVRIAALERMVGRLALENELLKKASQTSRLPKDGRPSVITGPAPSPSPRGAG